MQQGGSEERIISAHSSPRMQHKSYNLFGLFTKRSTKVEPHPVKSTNNSKRKQEDNYLHPTSNQIQEHDMSFAKCSPDKKPSSTSTISNAVMTNHINNNVRISNSSGGQTLLPNANVLNNNLSKSSTNSISGGLLSLQRRIKPTTSSSKTKLHRHSADGSQSDGGVAEVVLRKSPKHRSPNHNRFSHQFSLCCKVERRTLTPPVAVRYNSATTVGRPLKRDNLSQSWSMMDEASISSDINNLNAGAEAAALTAFLPQQLIDSTLVGVGGYKTLNECVSAPQSPVTAKVIFNENLSHSLPSSASVKSMPSDTQNCVNPTITSRPPANGGGGGGGGPIRAIPVTACRSRLRLKLLPPGKEMPKQLPPFDVGTSPQPVVDTIMRATTPQHMSSPNITSKPEVIIEKPDPGLRFMSHENIMMRRQMASQSGLAGLMANQMLNLIPVEQARERSSVDGHMGSLSLMGPSELNRVLPGREVTIFVGTWNMNGQSPPKQLNDFVLPISIEHVPDIVAIGTQESSPDRFGWEVTIQETLGPTHVLFHSTALGTLHLAIYMRRDLIWYCSAPEDASLSVRTGTAFRTKGAIAISFCVFGTSMLFVTSHLTAHQQKVKERVSDVKRIIHALDLPKNLPLRHKNKDVTQNFDNVFWCGDLNFRLGEPREKLLEWIQTTKFPLPSHLPHGYMHTDQLSSVLADGAAFRGFMEANITFPPTYKYDPGTQYFDTSSKQRAPAYTDRILYKYRHGQGLVMRRQSTVMGVSTPLQPYIQCLLYDSVPSITTSDHKPVLALFKTSIRAGTDSIPLAAGLFNRDIFLEGMKRRLNNQYSGSSAVCTIQ